MDLPFLSVNLELYGNFSWR